MASSNRWVLSPNSWEPAADSGLSSVCKYYSRSRAGDSRRPYPGAVCRAGVSGELRPHCAVCPRDRASSHPHGCFGVADPGDDFRRVLDFGDVSGVGIHLCRVREIGRGRVMRSFMAGSTFWNPYRLFSHMYRTYVRTVTEANVGPALCGAGGRRIVVARRSSLG